MVISDLPMNTELEDGGGGGGRTGVGLDAVGRKERK